MNLYLIGYRGTGKTTVARRLAERLGWPWLDADVVLEQRAGRTIAEIFEQGGEPLFRDLESQVVADLAKLDRHVIALGGGAVLREENRHAIRADGNGNIVWLQATPATIHARLKTDVNTRQRRPNLTVMGGREEIERLLEQRRPLYAALADATIDTEGKSPAQIADEILAAFQGSLKAEGKP